MCHRRVIYILLRMEQIRFKFNYLWQVLLIKLESTGQENPCQEVNFRKSKDQTKWKRYKSFSHHQKLDK